MTRAGRQGRARVLGADEREDAQGLRGGEPPHALALTQTLTLPLPLPLPLTLPLTLTRSPVTLTVTPTLTLTRWTPQC